MASQSDRERLRRARNQLDEWIASARNRAYSELFDGPDPALTDDEHRRLDRIDSHLSREHGRGLWGTDEYGVIPTGLPDEESMPRVICTYHPEIPFEAIRGEESLDEPIREEFNDVLWEYAERVADHLQDDLERFLSGSTRDGN